MFNIEVAAPNRRVAGNFQHVQMFRVPVLTFPVNFYPGSIIKPGNRFENKTIYFSETVRRSINVQSFPALCRALTSWSIEKPGAIFNRLSIFSDGQEVTGLISWQELGQLGDHFKIELGELLRLGLRAENGRLELRQPEGLLTNRQIRAAIYDLQTGGTEILPSLLFADIDQEGRVLIMESPDGAKTFLRVADPDRLSPHSIAEVRVESRDKTYFRLFRRDANRFRVRSWQRSRPTTTPGLTGPERLSTGMESKLIQAWIFRNQPLDPRLKFIVRSVRSTGFSGFLQLASKKGLPYLMRDVPGNFLDDEVRIHLYEEGGKKMASVELSYRAPKGETILRQFIYHLDPNQDHAIKLPERAST